MDKRNEEGIVGKWETTPAREMPLGAIRVRTGINLEDTVALRVYYVFDWGRFPIHFDSHSGQRLNPGVDPLGLDVRCSIQDPTTGSLLLWINQHGVRIGCIKAVNEDFFANDISDGKRLVRG